MTLLLYRCGFFQPPTKVIEYQEEVKLSDGSFIWVDIKRHYVLGGGGALGDAGNFNKLGYVPKIVEISWDTGFPDVGRQSVFFDENLNFIDKIDGVWYVVGQVYPYDGSLKGLKSVNCRDTGVLINARYQCVLRIDGHGKFIRNPIEAKQIADINMNILYTVGIGDWGVYPKDLDKTQLSWFYKLKLQKTQSKERQLIGKPYSYDFINSSNGGNP